MCGPLGGGHPDCQDSDFIDVLGFGEGQVGQGLTGPIFEQYMGHAPIGVTARHCVPRVASVTRGEQSELDRAMAQFRSQVVLPLETWIKAEKEKQKAGFSPFCTRDETGT